MASEDLRAVARCIVETMVREHTGEAAALVLQEILALGLFGGGEDETNAFADAVNQKLSEIAFTLGASRSWRLMRADPPTRQ